MDSSSRTEIVAELMRNLGLSLHNKTDRCLLQSAIEEAEDRGRQEQRQEAIAAITRLEEKFQLAIEEAREVPCDWEDLKHLSGQALRERLKDRVNSYRIAYTAMSVLRASRSSTQQQIRDFLLIEEMIKAKEQAISREVERLSQMERNGGYTDAEMDCKGCMGPCGRCEEIPISNQEVS